MMTRLCQWIVLMLLVVGALPRLADAQLRDPVAELNEARRIFVPVADLDVVIERDKQGVILPRAKFEALLTQAKANAEKNAVPAGVPVVMTVADYAAQIVGDQLLISVQAEMTQFDDDWRETRFALQRLALEQATFDNTPAMVGRHPDGSVSLFTHSRGKHTLKLQLSTELNVLGSDQSAAFSLLRAPSGILTLSLPAGKRLLVGNLQLERPAPLEQVADYKVAVGGASAMQLRITDRAAEKSADSLMFATTGYGLHVAPGEVTWHALSTLQVFGKPVDRLTFSVPSTLEIADVEATGLERWELSDNPNEPKRTIISLTFGQAFEGARKISFKGVMAVQIDKPWAVPPLQIVGVTSHIGQIVVQHSPGVRLRIDESTGVRRATNEQKSTADMPDDLSKLNASEFLRFDVWQPDFVLRLTTQPKQREIQAAAATVLDVNATGLDLQAALTVETHFAPLFEIDVQLPSEWQVLGVQKDNQPLPWQMVKLDEPGVNQLRIQLTSPLAAGASGQFRLTLRRDVEGWPVEAEPIIVNLPELFLPQSNLTESAFVVRGDEDLELFAFDLKGLDPQPVKAEFERLRFQSQDTRFSGKLKVTRKPSRIAAQTVTFGRLDPQTVHTFLQAIVEVQGGGVRSIKVALPEVTGTAIRFECPGPRIVEQQPAASQNSERIWTLQFDQRLRGQALIVCDIELPRGALKEFALPQWRFIDAERQNGYVAIEAGGEQRLTIVANEADGIPLIEVDPLDLPKVFYQPKERLVAVYRASAPGAVLSLSEQKFDKLPIPTAVCPLLEVSSILGRTGELQHKATFHLNVIGVQGLHVTFPTGSILWATTVDDRPVEVRRHGDVYLVPLAAEHRPGLPTPSDLEIADGPRVLQLFYRSEVAAVSKFGTLTQYPPSLTVESGQRTALPVEVLEQKWDLHYPEETRLVDSRSPLEPQQPLDTTSFLGDWNSKLRVPTLEDLGWQFIAVIVAIGIIALLTFAFRQKRLLLALGVFAVVSLLFPLTQSARKFDRKTAAHNERLQGRIESANTPESIAPPQSDQTDSLHSDRNRMHENKPAQQAPPTVVGLAAPPSFTAGVPVNPPGLNVAPAPKLGELAQNDPMQQPDDDKPAGQDKNKSTGGRDEAYGLLSLALDFIPPAGSREKKFHYVGADVSASGIPLEVDYVDRRSGAVMRIFVLALVAMIGWFRRRASTAKKVGLTTLGVVIPLALAPFVPVGWQVVLDGVLLGTLVTVVIWLVRCCVSCCTCCGVRSVKTGCATAVLLIAALICPAVTTFAAENETTPAAKSIAQPKPTTLIIPFDAGTDPLASERVFLSHELFLELYRLANPASASLQPAPQSGGIFEALYAAKLVPNAQNPDESIIQVTARYAVRSFVDGQLIVELPLGQVSAREVKLDGQTAALIANADHFQVAVSKSGLHVIDFAFDVPARLSGATGSFKLPLLPVPAGKLSFGLPAKDLSIRVNGSSTVFRRVTQGDSQSLELPVDKGGEIAITWQPHQSRDGVAAIVQADSALTITLTDAGGAISQGFAYRIRQGGLADTSFSLPDTLRLQAVSGPDVGGWELQGEGAARKLRVIFRRNVTDQTRLTIDTFLDVKVGASAALISVPQIAPQEVANEIGQIAVFAGNQFSIRAEQADSLAQIDGDKFATQVPVVRPNVAPQLAYRFSKRPFTLTLRASRQESQAHVTAQQAALITLRKQQLTTRLRYNLTGAPRSSLSIALPANFVLLDVQATGLRDWYVAKQDDGSLLTIELNAPRLGLTEVVIGGFAPWDKVVAAIKFPQPVDATRLDSMAAVWLEEGLTGTLDGFDGWRSIDPSQVGGELLAIRPQQPVRFAFASADAVPSAINLNLTQSMPQLSANGLSMVTVTDLAVIYTLALQWQIDAAKTDTLSLTTPNWLAGKLEFQGPGLQEAMQSDAGGDRTRWTIHLRTPISGKYFATATATLPPAATEVLAPALVFEHEQKPLDAQRQYVLLINSSMSQLTSVDSSLSDPVQREDVPVVVQQEFVDQATELVRVKALLTAPRWSLHKFAQQSAALASVNIADLTTVLSRDGTYRAQAIYTIKNRSRQFLALQMPEGTDLLSVFVAGQPSRAVEAKLPSLNGATVQLIALPKTSAASLSFPVKIVWRGRLAGPLPRAATFVREEFSVPAPQIISQQDDADFGIPVARTRWTVYLPNDLDAQAAGATNKHNLSLSDDSDKLYGNAALQETGELLGYLEQALESNRRVKTHNNQKQIDVAAYNLKQLGLALDSYQGVGDAEFVKNKTDIMRRLSEVEQLAKDESQKAKEISGSAAAQQQRSWGFQTESLADGEVIASEQQRELISSNAIAVDSVESKQEVAGFQFSLNLKESEDVAKTEKADKKLNLNSAADKSQGKKAATAGNETRQQLRDLNAENIDSLNSAVTTNNSVQLLRRSQLGQSGSSFISRGNESLGIEPNVGSNLWIAPGQLNVQQNPNVDLQIDGVQNFALDGGGMGGGLKQLGRKAAAPRKVGGMRSDKDQPNTDAKANPTQFLGLNLSVAQQAAGEGRGGAVGGIPAGGNLPLAWKQTGGLSLDIELPTSGRKLVFTKAGGDPKMTLAIRPQQTIRWGISLVWSAVWALMGLTILVTLRKAMGLQRLVHLLPVPVIVLGILGFFVLPTPVNGGCFVLFLIGAMAVAWQNRAPAIVEE